MAKICEKLIDRCLFKGSRDNMTAMVVAFEGAKIGAMTDLAMSDEEPVSRQSWLTVVPPVFGTCTKAKRLSQLIGRLFGCAMLSTRYDIVQIEK